MTNRILNDKAEMNDPSLDKNNVYSRLYHNFIDNKPKNTLVKNQGDVLQLLIIFYSNQWMKRKAA